MTQIIKCAPWLIVVVLALTAWHYRGSAADWERSSQKQENRANIAEQANDTLATANATLNARNNSLVESLDARSNELEAAQRRADANRTAYQQALGANRDWATGRVPDSVAASLRRATSGEDDTGGEGSGAK